MVEEMKVGETEPPVPPVVDPLLEAVQEVVSRRWTATSGDGEVVAEASGEQRLTRVELLRPDLPAALLGPRLTEAVNAALGRAREETVSAMQQLPELGPELRQVLGGRS